MPDEHREGEVIAGKYSLQKQLGSGATGEVWEALQKDLHDRRVALKFLHLTPEYERSDEMFQREVEVLARLHHPNVVRIIQHGVTEAEQKFLVMDYVVGVDFGEFLGDRNLTVEQFYEAMVQLFRGLDAIHNAKPGPVFHRDLKPRNVRYSSNGYTVIIDFGFAKLKDRTSSTVFRQSRLSAEDLADFMQHHGLSPEFVDPLVFSGRADATVDLYAVGGFIARGLETLNAALSREQKTGLQELNKRLRDKSGQNRFASAVEALHAFQNVFDVFAGHPVDKEEVRLFLIPEIAALASGPQFVRIPAGDNVPLTAGTRDVVQHPYFQRLRTIRQIPLVDLVFPGTSHTRFEHSLGTYLNVLVYLRRMIADQRFRSLVQQDEVRSLVYASLVHDIGHYPFAHFLEEMHEECFPNHLQESIRLVESPKEDGLGAAIRKATGLDPKRIADLLRGGPDVQASGATRRLLRSFLSGPLDADKVDYLERDSLHAGVPYGRSFDKARLIQSLCLNKEGDGLALAEKGKAALLMLIYARFIMFSEVYFHHAVRSAVAMLQRAVYDGCISTFRKLEAKDIINGSERGVMEMLVSCKTPASTGELASYLFGPTRRLYKRLRTYTEFREPKTLWRSLEPLSYVKRLQLGGLLAQRLSTETKHPFAPHHILIDVPPADKGTDSDVQLFYPDTVQWLPLDTEAPAVFGLQLDQYRKSVRKVRVFVHGASLQQAEKADVDALMADILGGI